MDVGGIDGILLANFVARYDRIREELGALNAELLKEVRSRGLCADRKEDPYAAGKAAAQQGLNETYNPYCHPSVASADWLRGHGEVEQERLAGTEAAVSGKQCR